jgi:hypothetical protein
VFNLIFFNQTYWVFSSSSTSTTSFTFFICSHYRLSIIFISSCFSYKHLSNEIDLNESKWIKRVRESPWLCGEIFQTKLSSDRIEWYSQNYRIKLHNFLFYNHFIGLYISIIFLNTSCSLEMMLNKKIHLWVQRGRRNEKGEKTIHFSHFHSSKLFFSPLFSAILDIFVVSKMLLFWVSESKKITFKKLYYFPSHKAHTFRSWWKRNIIYLKVLLLKVMHLI